MNKFSLFPLICLSMYGQTLVPAPIAQYDGITASAGSLTDLSGHGNNITLNGTTQTSVGTVCNGSSDYMTRAALLNNSDFTIIGIASSAVAGVFFAENNSNTTTSIRMAAAPGGGGSTTQIVGTGANVSWASPLNFVAPTTYGNLPHAYFFRRSGSEVTYGILDENLYTTQTAAITAMANSVMAICAQNFTGGPNSYWQGTLNYFAEWNVALPITGSAGQPSMVSNYNIIRASLAGRGIYMADVVSPLYPSRIYQRQGRLISSTGTEISGANEKVLYTTTDCKLVTCPAIQLFYDDGGGAGVKYSEIPYNPTTKVFGPVTIQSAVVIPNTHGQCSFVKDRVSNRYKAICANSGGSGTQFDLYTSTATNDATAFSLTQAAVLTSAGLGYTVINNSSILQPVELGNTFYFAFDAGITAGTIVSSATSADLITFSLNPANPVVGPSPSEFGGPNLEYVPINGVYSWQIWGHDLAGSGIYRNRATSWVSHWQRSSPSGYPALGQALPIAAPNNSDESSQMASASPIDIGDGNTYLFYCASDSTNILYLKWMLAPMPMSLLVQTGEGTASSTP